MRTHLVASLTNPLVVLALLTALVIAVHVRAAHRRRTRRRPIVAGRLRHGESTVRVWEYR